MKKLWLQLIGKCTVISIIFWVATWVNTKIGEALGYWLGDTIGDMITEKNKVSE